eukprot:23185-Chlamydomonas_euryale.AAC.3
MAVHSACEEEPNPPHAGQDACSLPPDLESRLPFPQACRPWQYTALVKKSQIHHMLADMLASMLWPLVWSDRPRVCASLAALDPSLTKVWGRVCGRGPRFFPLFCLVGGMGGWRIPPAQFGLSNYVRLFSSPAMLPAVCGDWANPGKVCVPLTGAWMPLGRARPCLGHRTQAYSWNSPDGDQTAPQCGAAHVLFPFQRMKRKYVKASGLILAAVRSSDGGWAWHCQLLPLRSCPCQTHCPKCFTPHSELGFAPAPVFFALVFSRPSAPPLLGLSQTSPPLKEGAEIFLLPSCLQHEGRGGRMGRVPHQAPGGRPSVLHRAGVPAGRRALRSVAGRGARHTVPGAQGVRGAEVGRGEGGEDGERRGRG